MVTAKTYQYFKCFIHMKSHLREKKKRYFPFEKFPSLVLSRNAIMLKYLIIQLLLYYRLSGRLPEVKNKDNFKLLDPKVVLY